MPRRVDRVKRLKTCGLVSSFSYVPSSGKAVNLLVSLIIHLANWSGFGFVQLPDESKFLNLKNIG